jgi:hypothetical protein
MKAFSFACLLVLFATLSLAQTTYNSDGTYSTRTGNTIYHSDGSYSTRSGNRAYDSSRANARRTRDVWDFDYSTPSPVYGK